jgi:Domain of unknown function (DUF3859)
MTIDPRHLTGAAVAIALAGFLLAARPVLADPLQIEIANAGETYTQEVGAPKLMPGNLAEVTAVTSPILMHAGTHITGKYCHQFGFSLRAINLPANQVVVFDVHVTHPLWKLPDGRSGTDEAWTTSIQGSRWGYIGYSLTEPWSLEPGTWTFTLSQGLRILATQSFELEVAPGQTMPADGCAPSIS